MIKFKTSYLLAFLFSGLLIVMFAIKNFDRTLKNDTCPNGIVSFELAKDIHISEAIINSWDTTAKIDAGLSLGIDFLFLLLYSGFIGLAIYVLNEKLWKQKKIIYQTGRLFVVFVFTAALLDTLENIALIRLLKGHLEQIWASIAFYAATVKFILVGTSLLYLIGNLAYFLYVRSADFLKDINKYRSGS